MSTLLLWLAVLAAPQATPPPDTPTVAERTAGLTRHDGFLPFYWDVRRGQLLLEVARWNQDFLYSSGLAGGAGLLEVSLDRGQLGELGLTRFERVGPRVLLRQRQTTHRSGVADRARSRVVEESFPSSVLASLPIVAEEGERVLVDATGFLLKDTGIVTALKRAQQGDFKQDSERSVVSLERTGAFPRNTEIEVLLSFVSDQPSREVAAVLPDGQTMSLTVHHTFLALPEPGFQPRPLDPRIGFIPQRHLEHTASFTEPIDRYLASRCVC